MSSASGGTEHRTTPPGRQIGTVGTLVRVVLGAFLLVDGAISGQFIVINGHLRSSWNVLALAIGLVMLPAISVAGLWLRARRDATRLLATGPRETALNLVVIVLVIASAYVAPISFIGFGGFIFYGATMLLAAARGVPGCEVTTVSNWILGRDDQIGCPVLSPIDQLDQRRHT